MTTHRPFVTGSHAYGIPEAKSDVDLVCLVTENDLKRLQKQADSQSVWNEKGKRDNHNATKLRSHSLHFGKVNLICCLDVEVYLLWRDGTLKLKKQRPVSHTFACKFFDKLRAKKGWK